MNPDIAVFSKAMSNGYPMASIIGTKSVMQAAENTFISSTYWTERIGPTAALATIQKYGNCNVSKHLRYIGECIQDIWLSSASTIGLPIEVGGISALPHFSIVRDESQVASTLFTQLMLEKGVLATNAFKATNAHRDEHMLAYSKSINEVFSIITKSIGDGDFKEVCHAIVGAINDQRSDGFVVVCDALNSKFISGKITDCRIRFVDGNTDPTD